jgi:hypothetical protein
MSYESFMEGVANDLTNEFVKIAPVDTSNLRMSIHCKIEGDIIRIMMPKYALYLEYGTGIFVEAGKGPGVPIKAKNGKALHWTDQNGEHFATSIKGMHAQPFIRNVMYHKLQKIVNDNAALHLDTEMEVVYS